jgi:hypothetical protein
MPPLSAEALGVAARAWRAAVAALLRARELGGAPGDASTSARRLARSARASRAPTSRSSASCRGRARSGVGRGPARDRAPEQVPVCQKTVEKNAAFWFGHRWGVLAQRAGVHGTGATVVGCNQAREHASRFTRRERSSWHRIRCRREAAPSPRGARLQVRRQRQRGQQALAQVGHQRVAAAPGALRQQRSRLAQQRGDGRVARVQAARRQRRHAHAARHALPQESAPPGPGVIERVLQPVQSAHAGTCARPRPRDAGRGGGPLSHPMLPVRARRHCAGCTHSGEQTRAASSSTPQAARERGRAHCWKPAGGCGAAAMSASSRRNACRHMRRTAGSTWPAAPRSRPSSATSSVPPGAWRVHAKPIVVKMQRKSQR